MTYSLVIPRELVRAMYNVREATGVSIRRQILNAVKETLSKKKKSKR